jgi:hypothetical protein
VSKVPTVGPFHHEKMGLRKERIGLAKSGSSTRRVTKDYKEPLVAGKGAAGKKSMEFLAAGVGGAISPCQDVVDVRRAAHKIY